MKAIFSCVENTPRILDRSARSRDSKLPGASIFENAIESIYCYPLIPDNEGAWLHGAIGRGNHREKLSQRSLGYVSLIVGQSCPTPNLTMFYLVFPIFEDLDVFLNFFSLQLTYSDTSKSLGASRIRKLFPPSEGGGGV